MAQDTSDSSTDTDTQPPLTSSGRTVLLLTIDTLNRDFVHASLNGEPITPELDRLFEESAYFPNTLVTRGQTSPSLASILTGLYPRTTMVRSNPRVLEADYATLNGIKMQVLRPSGFQQTSAITLAAELTSEDVCIRMKNQI